MCWVLSANKVFLVGCNASLKCIYICICNVVHIEMKGDLIFVTNCMELMYLIGWVY